MILASKGDSADVKIVWHVCHASFCIPAVSTFREQSKMQEYAKRCRNKWHQLALPASSACDDRDAILWFFLTNS